MADQPTTTPKYSILYTDSSGVQHTAMSNDEFPAAVQAGGFITFDEKVSDAACLNVRNTLASRYEQTIEAQAVVQTASFTRQPGSYKRVPLGSLHRLSLNS